MLYDIGYGAIQNKAEDVQRFCSDGFSFFHSMKRVGGKAMLKNQLVFGHVFLKKGFVKGGIGNQIKTPRFFFYIRK